MSWALTPRRVVFILATLIAVLGIAHFALVPWRFGRLEVFDLDQETSFGNWLSSFQLVLAGLLAGALAAALRRGGQSWRVMTAVASGLVLFGIDEVAALHERLSAQESAYLHIGRDATAGTPLMGLALLPFALAAVVALRRVLSQRAWGWYLAGTLVYWAATFGEEQIESWNDEHLLPRMLTNADWAPLLHGLQEVGEMVGVLFVVYALLVELARRSVVVSLRVVDDAMALPPVSPEPERLTQKR